VLFCDPEAAGAVVRDVVATLSRAGTRLRDRSGTRRTIPGPAERGAARRRRAPASSPTCPSTRTICWRSSYTSGTTGRPKGATITHRQALAKPPEHGRAWARSPRAEGRRRPVRGAGIQTAYLLVVPLFHVTGGAGHDGRRIRVRRKSSCSCRPASSTPTKRWRSSSASRSPTSAASRPSCWRIVESRVVRAL